MDIWKRYALTVNAKDKNGLTREIRLSNLEAKKEIEEEREI
jgi:hypothetical protein